MEAQRWKIKGDETRAATKHSFLLSTTPSSSSSSLLETKLRSEAIAIKAAAPRPSLSLLPSCSSLLNQNPPWKKAQQLRKHRPTAQTLLQYCLLRFI
jgi:hypothetical protein